METGEGLPSVHSSETYLQQAQGQGPSKSGVGVGQKGKIEEEVLRERAGYLNSGMGDNEGWNPGAG